MFFTQDDYRKIEKWLQQRSKKDTDFPLAGPMDGSEKIAIVQRSINKIILLNDFVKQVANMKLPDFYNVSSNSKNYYLTLDKAISLVPVKNRSLGLTITYHNERGNWVMYQFKGESLNQWTSLKCWNSIIQQAMEEFGYRPDEEDLTSYIEGKGTYLKFKDKEYNPEEFSGLGRIILRKNIVNSEACSVDGEDVRNNILTQEMINQENTVYIIQYDFDLDGGTLSIPKGCTLWFQGGTINNGTVYLQETPILGAFKLADLGNAKLFGTFNRGQIMTFLTEFKEEAIGPMEPGDIIEQLSLESSIDPNENLGELKPEKPGLDVVERPSLISRQELKWWNGEEWVLLLDVTDYNDIKKSIDDLINNHNKDISSLESRLSDAEEEIKEHSVQIDNHDNDIIALSDRLDDSESKLTTLSSKVTELSNKIDNIDITPDIDLSEIQSSISDISNRIDTAEADIESLRTNSTGLDNRVDTLEQNIESTTQSITAINQSIEDINTSINNLSTNVDSISSSIESTVTNIVNESVTDIVNEALGGISITGASAIKVNDETYTPDEDGVITLPDYPEESTVKEIVTSPSIIQHITNYMNKKTYSSTVTLSSIRSSYPIPEDNKYLKNKVFMCYKPNASVGDLFSTTVKNEETIDEKLAFDSEGTQVNLYKIGFDSSLLDTGNFGIVYSDDPSLFSHFTLEDFNSITSNTKSVGIIPFTKVNTGQYDSYGNETIFYVLDTEKLNYILDGQFRYYKGYINIPSSDIFFTSYGILGIKGLRLMPSLETINYNKIYNYATIDTGVQRSATFSDVTASFGDNNNVTLEFTMTLQNLYVVDSSINGLYMVEYSQLKALQLLRNSDLSDSSNSIASMVNITNTNEGSYILGNYNKQRDIVKISDNVYKCTVTYSDSYYNKALINVGATLAYASSNDNSQYSISDSNIYVVDRSLGTIRKLTTADFGEE